MASVSISANGATTSPYMYSTATVSEKSRSGTNVTLNVSIVSHLQYSSSHIGSGYVYKGTVTAYGTTKTITLKSSNESWSGSGNHTINTTMSITVPANITEITIGYKCAVSGYESKTVTGTNRTLTLSKVLATATSVTDFTDTTNPTIYFNNPGNFWLYPYINLWTNNGGTQIGTIIRPSDMSSYGADITSPYTWNLTEEQRNQIRDWLGTRSSVYATVGINTMSGTTGLGSSAKWATLTNVLAPPTFNDFEYEDINTNTTSITEDSSKIILGYSTLQITIGGNNKAIANKGASMSYYLVNGVQYTYSDNVVITLEKWNNSTITITAVDSRGNATSVTKTLTVAEYKPLEKGDATLVRDGNVSKETKLNYSGKATKTLPNGNANTINATYQYKKTSDTTYTTGTTNIAPSIDNDGNFDFDDYIVGDIVEGFSINDSFNIIITISDVLSSIQYNLTLNSGIPAIAVKENNIAIHGAYDVSLGGTQIYGDLFHNGEPIGEIDSYVNSYNGYIRFKNGIQIAWTEASVRTNSMAQWGNLYYQDFSGFQDWLEPFTGVFQQYATCSSFQFWVAPSDASVTSPGAVRILRPTNSSQTIYVKVIAIGKWK